MIYPKHVALIPDGNRTRAKQNGFSSLIGHMKGSKRVSDICRYIFQETNIDVFTVWGLSSENLHQRSEEELDYLYDLYIQFTKGIFPFMKKNSINLKWIGDEEGLSINIRDFLEKSQKDLTFDSNKYIVVAINYGGKNEIVRGVNKILNNLGIINKNKITEKEFEKHLDLYGLPQVDLLIRTKGDVASRLSGYLLWWIDYAELYFTGLKCPELTINEFEKILKWFDGVSQYRNFGK